MLLKLINIQGWIGIALTIVLSTVLGFQTVGRIHTQHQLTSVTALYKAEQSAHLQTEVNYRRAAEQARTDNLALVAKVKAEQSAINQRSTKDYEDRIAAARARADSLRHGAPPTAHPGAAGTAGSPGVRQPAPGTDEAPGDPRLPLAERLIATEQAIQLDELITWVEKQAGVKVNK